MDEFSKSFYYADNVIITDIYAAGEEPIESASAEVLVDEIKKHGHTNCVYMKGQESIIKHLKENLTSGDVLITLGAGDIYKIAHSLQQKG